MNHVQPSTESEVWHIDCLSVEGCAVAFNTYGGSHCSVFLWPQDVAVLFEHDHFRRRWAEELADNPGVQPVPQAPDMMWLLNGIAVSCPVRAAHSLWTLRHEYRRKDCRDGDHERACCERLCGCRLDFAWHPMGCIIVAFDLATDACNHVCRRCKHWRLATCRLDTTFRVGLT
jgi:hypothetical protein